MHTTHYYYYYFKKAETLGIYLMQSLCGALEVYFFALYASLEAVKRVLELSE